MSDKVKAALLCRLSNGRLPHCDQAPPSVPIAQWPIDGPSNDLGFDGKYDMNHDSK